MRASVQVQRSILGFVTTAVLVLGLMPVGGAPLASASAATTVSPSVAPAAARVKGRQARIIVKGQRYGKKAKVTLKGYRGAAKGVQKTVRVKKTKTVKRLKPGKYKVIAKRVTSNGAVAKAKRIKPKRVTVTRTRGATTKITYRQTKKPTPAPTAAPAPRPTPPPTPKPIPTPTSTPPPVDTTPPRVPAGLAADAGHGQVALSWSAVTAGDLVGYRVYQATARTGPWTQVTPDPISARRRTVTGLANGTTYWFTVAAEDKSQNTSAKSNPTSATPIAPDTTAPGPVAGLTASKVTTTSIKLSWTNPTDADLVKVLVRRAKGDTAPTGPGDGTKVDLNSAKATAVTDSDLDPDTTYSYAVFTEDATSNVGPTASPLTVTTLAVPAPGMDLRGRDLSGADLVGRDLHDVDLTGADISGADLTGANLSGAILTGADLTGTKLTKADLQRVTSGQIQGQVASLPDGWRQARGHLLGAQAILDGADLSGLDLREMDFTGASLKGADLSGADLSKRPESPWYAPPTRLDSVNLEGADLSNANLQAAVLWGANLRSANIDHANFRYIYLGKGIRSGELKGEPEFLQYAQIHNGYLVVSGADLSGADLRGFKNSIDSLWDMNLTDANLEGVDFALIGTDGSRHPIGLGGDLTRANLRGANLSGSLVDGDFSGADLSHANFEKATLSGKFTGATIQGIRFAGASMKAEISGGLIGQPDGGVLPEFADYWAVSPYGSNVRGGIFYSKWLLVDGHFVGPYTDLRGADLSGADLRGIGLGDSNLEGVDMSGSKLTSTSLRHANLRNANLSGASMARAAVDGATILEGTNFAGADLTEADFFHANLEQLDLAGAILPETRIVKDYITLDYQVNTVVCPVDYRITGGNIDYDSLPPSGYDSSGQTYTTYETVVWARPIEGDRGLEFRVEKVTTTRSPESGEPDIVTRSAHPVVVYGVCVRYFETLFLNMDTPGCEWDGCSYRPPAATTRTYGSGSRIFYIRGYRFAVPL